jgi:hypothetical protein
MSDEARATSERVIIETFLLMMRTQFFILFEALRPRTEPGEPIDYTRIQEAIAMARERIPENLYGAAIRDFLNGLEQAYQPGPYPPVSKQPSDRDH